MNIIRTFVQTVIWMSRFCQRGARIALLEEGRTLDRKVEISILIWCCILVQGIHPHCLLLVKTKKCVA